MRRRTGAVEATTLTSSIGFADESPVALSSAAPDDDRGAVLVVVEDGDRPARWRLSVSSIWKHSGALMSSRLMPPKVGSSS